MDDENMVEGETLESQDNGVSPETTPNNEVDVEGLRKKAEAYEAQKIRAEKAEAELRKSKSTINNQDNSIDSVDLIKLGKKLQDYSDDELDFVTEYANSKKPEAILKALENPFIQQGIKARREQVEQEKLTLKPSSTQPESDIPRSLEEKLEYARNDAERESILREAGLYSEPQRRTDGVNIRV